VAPVIDRTRRARRDASITGVTDIWIDDVIAAIVRDRIDWAGFFTGVATNADDRVDQVLLQHAI
jgi:hypothetical protein